MLLKDRLQRIAFARILSDLIEADSIIEDDEMRFLEDLNERFRISREMLAEARKKNFAWALNTLKHLSDEQKSEIRQVLKDLSMSDGTCVPNEALQIMAALFVLEDKGEVFPYHQTQATLTISKSYTLKIKTARRKAVTFMKIWRPSAKHSTKPDLTSSIFQR